MPPIAWKSAFHVSTEPKDCPIACARPEVFHVALVELEVLLHLRIGDSIEARQVLE
jgi:hypothetical protein